MAIRPLHPLTQENGKGAAIVGDFPALGDIGGDFIAGIVPKQNFVMPATAITIPEVSRTAEATAPRTAVFANLVHGLDHQRVLTDPFLHWWQLPRLHQYRQLWSFLKTLGKLCCVSDHLWTFKFPGEITASRSCGDGVPAYPSGQCQHTERHGEPPSTLSCFAHLPWSPHGILLPVVEYAPQGLVCCMEHTVRPAPL